jgi:hypothetical protein
MEPEYEALEDVIEEEQGHAVDGIEQFPSVL